MKKALLVTHVSGFVPQFEMNNVHILQKMGYQIHYAANYNTPFYGINNERLDKTNIIRHQIDFVRNPYHILNIKAYHQLKKLMAEEQFQLVHCHNPISGVISRLSAHAVHLKPVIYTAHGFHFYKGASPFKWITYYTIEYLLSYITDQQICINKEDYERAKKHFHAKKTTYIPGVGIDIKKIDSVEVNICKKKKELDIPDNAKVLISTGELSHRKNHDTIIKTMALLEDESVYCIICGHGGKEEHLKQMVQKLHLERRVLFAGYRNDIYELLKMADIFVFSSFQEGLSMALLEALACGLPIVCSDIRGNNELIDQNGGYLADPKNPLSFKRAIEKLLADEQMRKNMGAYNKRKAHQYNCHIVTKAMEILYKELLDEYDN